MASAGVWDEKSQTPHGGQEWKFLSNFVDDFSVTTNVLGTPQAALEAARESVSIFVALVKSGILCGHLFFSPFSSLFL